MHELKNQQWVRGRILSAWSSVWFSRISACVPFYGHLFTAYIMKSIFISLWDKSSLHVGNLPLQILDLVCSKLFLATSTKILDSALFHTSWVVSVPVSKPFAGRWCWTETPARRLWRSWRWQAVRRSDGQLWWNTRMCSPEVFLLNNWTFLENHEIHIVHISYTETVYTLYTASAEGREMSSVGGHVCVCPKCSSRMDVHVFPHIWGCSCCAVTGQVFCSFGFYLCTLRILLWSPDLTPEFLRTVEIIDL